MAAVTGIHTLPSEFIAHIASYTDARTALCLTKTSRKIHEASYDVLVFQAIIETSKHTSWECGLWYRKSRYLQTIAEVAGKDVRIWARYALADHKAHEQIMTTTEIDSSPMGTRNPTWLPELFVITHPTIFNPNWVRVPLSTADRSVMNEFCRALAVLASPDPASDEAFVCRFLSPEVERGTTNSDFLMVLSIIAIYLRTSVGKRLAAWPYNGAANVPYIQPPRIQQIPIVTGVRPPLPFGDSRVWNSWYERYNEGLYTSPNYFTDGAWCGYYTGMDDGLRGSIDPPMVGIKFQVVPTPEYRPDELSLRATDCRDGLGLFDVTGGFTHSGDDETGDIEFTALKQYHNNGQAWLWDLKLTPFGLVGYWGSDEQQYGGHGEFGMARLGLVWLWKESWTKA
ncbi:hypothetical protein LTR49_014301 [Elasticomyces elasticus]|nr:hypothetical protein LTR49_014301 [Elasticomyces elasticus]KAK5757056.1 hypothetical protein LTS12_012870 [Elasticomyces elasticus]